MPTTRINKRSVDALVCRPGRDRSFLWDDVLAGFGVAAFPSGKKVYVVQYRQFGRSRRSRIGEHGRLTPDQARSLAKALLGLAETGADPIAERRAARAIPTFREVGEDFLRSHVQSKRKPRTAEEYERLLTSIVYPAIGAKRICELRGIDIAKMHDGHANSPYQANRALAVTSAIWNWAARRELVEAHKNPAAQVDRFPEHKRERYLSSEELVRLGAALSLAEKAASRKSGEDHSPDVHAIAAIRLLIFTGARLQEILKATWDQVDLERGILNLSDSKTGAKTIYLNASARQILRGLPRIVGNAHLIPGARVGSGRADLKRPWASITKAAKLDGLRIHDLRHSFASVAAGASLGLPIIGKLLGHSQAATTQRYAHLAADPMVRAAEIVGSRLSAALAGNPMSDD